MCLIVYQREPHAGQLAFRDVEQPQTRSERVALARRTAEELALGVPILIDELDDRSRAWFGDLPSPAIVIDPRGVVRSKLPWAEPDVLGPRLPRAADDPARDAAGDAERSTEGDGDRARLATLLASGGPRGELEAFAESTPDAELRAIALRELADDADSVAMAIAAVRTAWEGQPATLRAALAELGLHVDDPSLARPVWDALEASLAEDDDATRGFVRSRRKIR